MQQFGFITYLLLKYMAYSAWCYVDLKKQKGAGKAIAAPALGWGLFRLGLGIGFGLVIYLASSAVVCVLPYDLPARELFTYLLTYVPIRWIEWGIMDILLSARKENLASFLLGSNAFSRKWRLGGIFISCAADGPMMIMLGAFPVGRFMC